MKFSPFILVFALGGCVGGIGDKDMAGDDSGDTDTDTDTTPVDRGTGNVTGTVSVQLYQEDADGNATELSWEDYGGEFPFGAIYVAAYSVDETTNETTYYDEQVISAPSTAGDPYELTIDVDAAEEVQVYAALDWWPDGVIGTYEPIGLYGDLVPVVEDGSTDDVDIVIQAPLWPLGGGGGTYVTLDGDVTIDQEYTGGDGKVMLYTSDGVGPSYVTSFAPTATEDGAEASFSLVVGADYGEGRLLGAWDDDQNGLIDPTDTWGAYVVEGESGNPITVGSDDADGYTVLIPYGIPPALHPFVRLEGALTYDDDFSTLPAGTTVYVTALRVTPGVDFSGDDLERGYDWQSFTSTDLVGTSLDYVLVAPSSAVAYLWAFADVDGDGILNEVGEPVGNYGRGGRLSTGTDNQTGLDMHMAYIAE